ncbi:MAG: serine hydrolase [Steroidobacteraceae bacterium]
MKGRTGAAKTGVLAALLAWFAPAALAAGNAPVQPLDRFPDIAPVYAVAIDGRLTWGAHIDEPRRPASLAKLITALALLDAGWQPEAIVTVSARAAGIEGSRIGLRTGERLRADDLLTGMLVRSGNDACLALVEHVAGSLAKFLPRLDARAKALGMTASTFRHPCGLDADGTRTTARDLLILAKAALAEPRIALRGHAVEGHVRTEAGRDIRFRNSNALIGRDPDAVGLKSGYTKSAGRCLIAVSRRGSHEVILVMLGAEERWWAASSLLAQGLAEAVIGTR